MENNDRIYDALFPFISKQTILKHGKFWALDQGFNNRLHLLQFWTESLFVHKRPRLWTDWENQWDEKNSLASSPTSIERNHKTLSEYCSLCFYWVSNLGFCEHTLLLLHATWHDWRVWTWRCHHWDAENREDYECWLSSNFEKILETATSLHYFPFYVHKSAGTLGLRGGHELLYWSELRLLLETKNGNS